MHFSCLLWLIRIVLHNLDLLETSHNYGTAGGAVALCSEDTWFESFHLTFNIFNVLPHAKSLKSLYINNKLEHQIGALDGEPLPLGIKSMKYEPITVTRALPR